MRCVASDELVVVGFDRQHNIGGRFPVVRCRTCGLARTSPRPTAATIAAYYPQEYAPYQRLSAPAPPAMHAQAALRVALHRLADPRSESIPPIPPGRMIEIGCASGSFLATMRDRGWQVAGIEPSPYAANRAREQGFDVYTGMLDDAPEPAAAVDLVVGWMVFEHLHRPRDALARLRDWMAPSGWLALSVPDFASIEARLFGDAWWALDVPRHLHHFTPATLRQMLDAEGWVVERTMHQRTLANTAASLGHLLEDAGAQSLGARMRNAPAGRWVYATAPLSAISAALRQTGRITVWARRA